MELRTLITFLRIAELQSFSKAADELAYSQAAVTIQIRELEKELNTRLFDRIGKKISLTHQGECFLLHARKIIEEVDNARNALQEDPKPSGTLKIGMVESLCSALFPDLLKQYHNLYPQVDIQVETAAPEKLLAMLDRNELDFVYILDQQRLSTNWIKVIEKTEEIVFVCAASHPLAKRSNLTLNDLLQETFILTERNVSYRHELDQRLLQSGLAIKPYLEIGNTDFIIQMIRNQQGISFLPKFTVSNDKALTILSIKDFSLFSWQQVLYHKNKWINPQMKAFFDLLNP